MKVLITGGAGFIGFHLSKFLKKNNDLTICDNLFRGKVDDDLKKLLKLKNVKFINCDLTKKQSFNKLDRDYDYIFHLAAINGTNYFYEIPHIVLKVNILGLLNLLEWVTGTDCRKILFTSSSEVYAGTPEISIPTPEEVKLTISDIKNPRFSYAGSKIMGELLCINYSRAYGLDIRIVRPHNIYGPRMGYEHVIPQFIMRIINKENPFRIYGGDQTRAFCYVDDFVRGIQLLADSPTTQKIFNLGNDMEEIKIVELAKLMFRLFDFTSKIEIMPPLPGSTARRCPDISKARNILNYNPTITLEEGLRKTYDWYLKSGR